MFYRVVNYVESSFKLLIGCLIGLTTIGAVFLLAADNAPPSLKEAKVPKVEHL